MNKRRCITDILISIPIHERVELPESWIPADSRVEIDAKITAGTMTKSRAISLPPFPLFFIADPRESHHRLLYVGTSYDRGGTGGCSRQNLGRVCCTHKRPPPLPPTSTPAVPSLLQSQSIYEYIPEDTTG